MSVEAMHSDEYDRQLDRIVDTQNVPYAVARELLDDTPGQSDTFNAAGEVDLTGIPKTIEEVPLGSLAGSALHVIESAPYISSLKRDGPEIARLVGRGEISVEEADILFSAIKKRRAELSARPLED